MYGDADDDFFITPFCFFETLRHCECETRAGTNHSVNECKHETQHNACEMGERRLCASVGVMQLHAWLVTGKKDVLGVRAEVTWCVVLAAKFTFG